MCCPLTLASWLAGNPDPNHDVMTCGHHIRNVTQDTGGRAEEIVWVEATEETDVPLAGYPLHPGLAHPQHSLARLFPGRGCVSKGSREN